MLMNLIRTVAGAGRAFRLDEILWIVGYVIGRIAPIIIGWYLAIPASNLLLRLMGN